ncbi:cytochrome c oxidase subunit 3 [Methylobacterium dankookense]|uniref:Cytochrome bo(3) ubiquinol oxidase subunit 3 n=1 Tax=Methylobacterium dankookense TaxID=560405 RepID=A0A564FRU7_9HYPH|nr:cytochrome c oxidase subunit 3 [Methylobacterium dankookense]GJD57976.1 Cytochrome bo(3) ubiquinol oxidase subunit 3 [Methylobacterium dankookense]VUF10434.1 Cytochrome bo(3) ubiquinol oxidase subunit 3 [Methylobacterium dankookense]
MSARAGEPQLRHVGLNLLDTDALEPGEAATGLYGFWLFLMSDAILFALLFAIYGTQLTATAGAPGPQDAFKIGPTFVETLILLTSSLTFGLASIALKYDRGRTGLVLWLSVTLTLGIAFLGFEIGDFRTMFADGATPDRSGFLSAFFALVPTHGLHVAAGCLWIVVMLAQIAVFGTDARFKLNLLKLGLFWHLLDIVWIAIFSVVYLQGTLA